MPPAKPQGFHSLQVTHWLKDNSLLCRNTHGEAEPLPAVPRSAFQCGYWVDVEVRETSTLCDEGHRMTGAPNPQVTAAWKEIGP